MNKLRKAFGDAGLEPADLPKALVIHEILGIAFAAAAWTACYTIQPSKNVGRPIASVLNRTATGARVGKAYGAAAKAAAAKMQQSALFQKGVMKGKNAPRLTTSFGESLAFRAIVKPITFPIKIWASWRGVVLLKQRGESQRIKAA